MTIIPIAPVETESDRLRAKCTQALKDEHMTGVQINALQKKIKALRRRGKVLHEDTAVKKVKSDAAILEYAKSACRELCDLVYKKFPREIRDIIYGYVADCDEVLIVSDSAKDGEGFKCLDMKYDIALQHRLCSGLDPWWDPDFVGPVMVRELGENLYRTTSFQFDGDFHLISKFRITDQWKLGFLPVSFVSNVEVYVRCEDYQLGPYTGKFAKGDQYDQEAGSIWEPDYYTPRPKKQTPSDLLVGLESLFGFRCGTAITIKTVLTQYAAYKPVEKQEWMCDEIVPFIFPAIDRLKDSGYDVRVVLIGDKSLCSPTWSPIWFISDWNPACVEEFTKSFWEYVEAEQKAQQQALYDAELDESFSQGSVTSRDNQEQIWGHPSQGNNDAGGGWIGPGALWSSGAAVGGGSWDAGDV